MKLKLGNVGLATYCDQVYSTVLYSIGSGRELWCCSFVYRGSFRSNGFRCSNSVRLWAYILWL
jgi:hypothetical protein